MYFIVLLNQNLAIKGVNAQQRLRTLILTEIWLSFDKINPKVKMMKIDEMTLR